MAAAGAGGRGGRRQAAAAFLFVKPWPHTAGSGGGGAGGARHGRHARARRACCSPDGDVARLVRAARELWVEAVVRRRRTADARLDGDVVVAAAHVVVLDEHVARRVGVDPVRVRRIPREQIFIGRLSDFNSFNSVGPYVNHCYLFAIN